MATTKSPLWMPFTVRLGGLHWVDRLERWAMKSPEVDKLEVGRYESVFADQPLWASRVTKIFGTGKDHSGQ